jgi:hypothetical protein
MAAFKKNYILEKAYKVKQTASWDLPVTQNAPQEARRSPESEGEREGEEKKKNTLVH